ncbi:MAG: ATP-dependent DNA helicase RecG [Clostridia bacterium]|nr:ATP-dependent DNA helicase RecG [Clostridia bacterium]
MQRFELDTPVSSLGGIGKVRAEKLARLGIYTLGDLLYHFPRSYENRADVRPLGSFATEAPHAYVLTVASSVSSARLKNRMTLSKFRAFDDSGSAEIVFFNSPYVKDVFRVGDTFRFYGKATFNKMRRLTLSNPKFEPMVEGVALDDFVPIYPMTDGLSSKILEKLIRSALDDLLPFVEDPLPENIRLREGLPSLSYAIRNAHMPKDQMSLATARRRLAFDEMLHFAISISISAKRRERTEGVPFSPCSLSPLTALLPYELTGAQKNAINDIYRDTVLTKRNGITPAMARIIVGDVGSGKTVCAAAAMYLAFKSGYQSALMAPTEILANQHYQDLSELLGKVGARVALLTASVSAAKKRQIYARLESGEIDIVIGTHALLNERVNFSALGLIVTDEQHRFGVGQRGILKDRSAQAHMLVMSATPIPRTLALALYGDLDISRIDEMPKGRIPVDTFVVDEGYRSRLNSFIEKQVALGGQCYIVCPSIEKNEDDDAGVSFEGVSADEMIDYNTLDLKNAVEYAEELRKALPGLNIKTLHGRMKNAEKDEIMTSFATGETDVLVSTTVIEVGVNVPNASLMIVENSERFGLSQLHQLRGRVGRGSRKSYCVLVSDSRTEKARARLDVMRTTHDGYEIAEKDLVQRGPGDFFSSISGDNIRQSGGFDFSFAKDCEDTSLLDLAFCVAREITASDPELSHDEHKALRSIIGKKVTRVSEIS